MHLASLLAIASSAAFLSLPFAAQSADLSPPPPTQTVSATELTQQDVAAWADGFMPYALKRGDIAGAVVVVVKGGAVLFKKGYGYSDIATHKPVDPERTLFRIGSTSKLFTWTAVMQLVEQGKIDLDVDVNHYLDLKIPEREGRPVTMRDIMTHTAGFEEVLKSLIETDPPRLLSLEAIVKRWIPERIFPAGSTPAYSNYATALAGYIVQRVSGESFEGYIDRHIFAPLGMEHSSLRQPLPKALQIDMSKGYALASEPQPEKPYELIAVAPAGAVATTGADMAHFMIAHLQNGAFGTNRILKTDTAQQMHTTALTMIPPLDRMLLGFYENNYNGHRVIGHGGDTQWFHSDLNLFIDNGIGLFFSVNSLGKEGAAHVVREAFFQEFSDRYLPGPTASGNVAATVAAEHARLMSGHYEMSRRAQSSFFSFLTLMGEVKVSANDDNTLDVSFLQGFAGEPLKWKEIEPFVWREVGGKTLLAAKIENGRVARFSVGGLSPFTVIEPAPWWRSAAWLLPLLIASAAALTLTALLWPVAALVRCRFRAVLDLTGTALTSYRLSRIAAAAVVVTLIAWISTLAAMLSNLKLLSPSFDLWFWFLQLLSLVVFFGAAAISLWNARVVWATKPGWFARGWSIVLVASSLTVVWVALAYKLIGFDVNY